MTLSAGTRVNRIASLVVFAVTILWLTVGYVVAPVLFLELPSKQAGDVAGILFNISSLVVLVTLIMIVGVYIGLEISIKSIKSLILGLLLLFILRFWIAPWMADIKESYPQGLLRSSPDWELFSTLHGVYQLIYLAVIILLLIWSFKAGFKIEKAPVNKL